MEVNKAIEMGISEAVEVDEAMEVGIGEVVKVSDECSGV